MSDEQSKPSSTNGRRRASTSDLIGRQATTPTPGHNEGALARWARFAASNPWKVIGAWVIVLVLAIGGAQIWGAEYSDSFVIPGSESQEAIDILNEKMPTASGDTAEVVFKSEAGIADPTTQQAITDLQGKLAQLPGVIAVEPPNPQAPGSVSQDGKIGVMVVRYNTVATEVDQDGFDQLLEEVDAANTDTLTVEVGGAVVQNNEFEAPAGTSELIGIGIAMIIMLVMFGSVVAMGLPIITALIGLMIGIFVAPLFANMFTLSSSVTAAFLSMMGLGVGIDYALFIVNRYRDALLEGKHKIDAAVIAINTSGRAVAFAGVTVAIAMLGLSLVRIPFVTGLGIVGSLIVVISVLVALFLMPAILGLVGNGVLRWRVPGLGSTDTESQTGFFAQLGRTIQARPGIISGVVLVVLAIVAVPFFSMQLGLSDAGNGSEDLHSKRAYDLISEGFGPGANGQFLLVLEDANGFDQAQLDTLGQAIANTEGVVAVSPAFPNESGDTAIIQITPSTSPQDADTEDLVHRLRDETLPSVLQGTEIQSYLGGSTAANIDLSTKISDRMLLFMGTVIGLSVIFLAAVFRSLVVPVKAAILNLVSVGAAFGAIVAVFQWGWFKGLLGLDQTGPVESFLPMMLFGIIFGLSMDYEVFLLTRVHEEYTRTGDAKFAIRSGLRHSGRVIAAAGGIMTAVFFAFVLEEGRVIKELGFGLGIAIVFDAFFVRLILVPGIMTLLDKTAWYMPKWLDRILPKLNVEG